jgi:hypothetical protein
MNSASGRSRLPAAGCQFSDERRSQRLDRREQHLYVLVAELCSQELAQLVGLVGEGADRRHGAQRLDADPGGGARHEGGYARRCEWVRLDLAAPLAVVLGQPQEVLHRDSLAVQLGRDLGHGVGRAEDRLVDVRAGRPVLGGYPLRLPQQERLAHAAVPVDAEDEPAARILHRHLEIRGEPSIPQGGPLTVKANKNSFWAIGSSRIRLTRRSRSR